MTSKEQAEQKAFELQKEYILKIEDEIISNFANPNLKGNPLNLSFPIAVGLIGVCRDLLDYIYGNKVKGDEDD